jgi:mitochondrial fission protein ELM1
LLETQTPDIVIASGRRAVPLVRWIKKHIANVFTVILKDPRTRFSGADLIWVSEHDTLRGDHVMTTLTTPHRHSTGKLALAWATPDPRLKDLPSPRVAVLLGGNSRHHHFSNDDQARLMDNLTRLTEQGVRIMVTPSRRTPETLLAHIKALCVRTQSFFWDGTGDNPYLAILALADAVVVTADSTNMVGEAAATGKPILLFEPSGGHPKITQFLQAMMEKGYAHLFTGQLTGAPYTPIDSTPIIAERIMARMRQRAPDA